MPRAAIFGGSFNPPHLGHLIAARAAIASADLDRLYWVPARRPPHKPAGDLAPLAKRAYMLRLALADDPISRIVCEPIASPGYGWDTFEFLRDREPNCQWSWLLGLDAFTRLPYWYRRQELVPAISWLVVPRLLGAPNSLESATTGEVPTKENAGANLSERARATIVFEQTLARLRERGTPAEASLLPMPLIELSATDLRARYGVGKSCLQWVPAAVDRYILKTGLYRETY